MKIYLGDITLPDYSFLTELTEPNATELYGLDGTLGVDYVNYRRGWKIGWKLITKANYDLIREKFEEQFTNGVFCNFGIPDKSINKPVYIKISDTARKYNDQLIEGFEIELIEQYAIS